MKFFRQLKTSGVETEPVVIAIIGTCMLQESLTIAHQIHIIHLEVSYIEKLPAPNIQRA